MQSFNIKEFKPAIVFLVKFFCLYLVGNLLYGWFVTSWYPQPDPITNFVTEQCAYILKSFGWEANSSVQAAKPTTYILNQFKPVVAVYEGCNGVNILIVFLAFLFGFGSYSKLLIWFIPLGALLIHVTNLARIILLFIVSIHLPSYSYFAHKYLFTAVIYFIVFLLWVWWVYLLTKKTKDGQAA